MSGSEKSFNKCSVKILKVIYHTIGGRSQTPHPRFNEPTLRNEARIRTPHPAGSILIRARSSSQQQNGSTRNNCLVLPHRRSPAIKKKIIPGKPRKSNGGCWQFYCKLLLFYSIKQVLVIVLNPKSVSEIFQKF